MDHVALAQDHTVSQLRQEVSHMRKASLVWWTGRAAQHLKGKPLVPMYLFYLNATHHTRHDAPDTMRHTRLRQT